VLAGKISSKTNRDSTACNPHSTRVDLLVLELILGHASYPPSAVSEALDRTSVSHRYQTPGLIYIAYITMRLFSGLQRWQRVDFIGPNAPSSPSNLQQWYQNWYHHGHQAPVTIAPRLPVPKQKNHREEHTGLLSNRFDKGF